MAVATGATPADIERVRRRLREDYEFVIDRASAVKIVAKSGETITMVLKRPQRRLVRALMRQREAGRPQRAIILKARQVGFSTLAQALGIMRATQTENHVALTIAQERDTTSALFDIGRFVWANLPGQIKPPAAREGGTKERRYLLFGEPGQQLRRAGVLGLNSAYETATAKTAAAARGRTIRTLHMSEVAFWGSDEALLGIQQGVPDLASTLILKESTANGHNFFKDEWDLAEAGESDYYPMFTPWFEEDEYRRAFANEREMWDFEASIGSGTPGRPEIGDDEQDLAELIPAKIRAWAEEDGVDPPSEEETWARTLEHLNWRRWAIPTKTQGKVAKFHQEYPSTPEEAFLSTGRKVFDSILVRRALAVCERTDPAVPSVEHPGPARGLLRGAEMQEVRVRRGVTLEVPQKALWVPRSRAERGEASNWRVWQLPQEGEWISPNDPTAPPTLKEHHDGPLWRPSGQYLVNVDPASGEEDEQGMEHADHAIVVLNHRTLEVVAEYTSQADPDMLALETLLAALFWNRALVTVERTGGWGLPLLRILSMDYKYPRLFERETVDQRVEKRSDRLGFSTDPVTKPILVARAEALLRDHPELISSRTLAGQMLTYVRDKRGRMLPEAGKLADVLMAWMIGQHVASIRKIRPEEPGGGRKKKRGGPSVQPRRVRSRAERRGGR